MSETTSIENKIEEIIELLEVKKETHPVFAKVWTLYLREKLNNLKIITNRCEELINSDLSSTPDLNPQMMASLFSILRDIL